MFLAIVAAAPYNPKSIGDIIGIYRRSSHTGCIHLPIKWSASYNLSNSPVSFSPLEGTETFKSDLAILGADASLVYVIPRRTALYVISSTNHYQAACVGHFDTLPATTRLSLSCTSQADLKIEDKCTTKFERQ